MKTVSMKKRFVTTNVVVSIMFMFVSVQAQGFISSPESTSLVPESEFPQNSNDPKYALDSSEIVPNSQISSESEFLQDTNDPFESEFSLENVSNAEIQLPPPAPGTFNSSTKPPPSPTSTKPVPCPPKHPWIRDNTCVTRCSTMCVRHKVPILNNLCNEICRRRCILYISQMVFDCTVRCAHSMPKICKSDKKKEAGYVSFCYHKCIKKF